MCEGEKTRKQLTNITTKQHKLGQNLEKKREKMQEKHDRGHRSGSKEMIHDEV